MASTLDGLRYLLLVFQTGTGETAGKDLSLFIDELEQKIRVFVVDVPDSILLEAAVLRFRFRPLDRLVCSVMMPPPRPYGTLFCFC